MNRVSRDRITVDLRGLRSALFEQARARGVRPSDFVRASLAFSLTSSEGIATAPRPSSVPIQPVRVRLSLRMSREDSLATSRAARKAGLPPGDFVAELVAGAAVQSVTQRPDYLSQLAASSAELSTLSRNIHHLTRLLREGSVRAAMEYRNMLDALADDVRKHLLLASAVLEQSRPRSTRDASKEP